MNLNLYYRKIYKKFKERKYEGNLDGDTEGQTLCAEYGTPFPSYTYLAPPIEFLKAKDETQKHLLRSSCSFDPVSHFVEQYPDLKPETIKRYKLIILLLYSNKILILSLTINAKFTLFLIKLFNSIVYTSIFSPNILLLLLNLDICLAFH